jgi:hypothetical protein
MQTDSAASTMLFLLRVRFVCKYSERHPAKKGGDWQAGLLNCILFSVPY